MNANFDLSGRWKVSLKQKIIFFFEKKKQKAFNRVVTNKFRANRDVLCSKTSHNDFLTRSKIYDLLLQSVAELLPQWLHSVVANYTFFSHCEENDCDGSRRIPARSLREV